MLRTLFALSLSSTLLLSQDAREIVRRSVNLDNANWERARNYNFVQRIEERKLDDAGKVDSVESKTYDVFIVSGEAYSKLVARNDKPLPDAEQRKEQSKLSRAAWERERNPGDGKANIEKERQRRQQFLKDLPETYNCKLVGEEVQSGRPVWVIELEPRSDYKPSDSRAARILPHLRGKLWVDKGDYQWVRAEAEVIHPITFGGFLARLAPGARFAGYQIRVNNEVWLPKELQLSFDARLALIKRYKEEVRVTYGEYKKFQSESRILPAAN